MPLVAWPEIFVTIFLCFYYLLLYLIYKVLYDLTFAKFNPTSSLNQRFRIRWIWPTTKSWISVRSLWWRWGESNSWPPACKAGALPTELHPHVYYSFLIKKRFLNKSVKNLKVYATYYPTVLILWKTSCNILLRKEVIQPHLPIRLPCYDFTPVINPTFDACFPKVSSAASGITNFRGVTGGVYKTRERIHRDILIRDY